MTRERDRSLTPLPGSSGTGRISDEVERDITQQIELHAGRALSRLLRRVLVAAGWSGAGLLGGVGGVLIVQDDAPVTTTKPASGPSPAADLVAAAIPPSLLVPPADERLLEACEQAGADARRAIRDARLCVDTFAMAAESCDPAAALTRQRRPAAKPTEDP